MQYIIGAITYVFAEALFVQTASDQQARYDEEQRHTKAVQKRCKIIDGRIATKIDTVALKCKEAVSEANEYDTNTFVVVDPLLSLPA